MARAVSTCQRSRYASATITLFLIVLISLGGLMAFFKLGRAEDPSFTIKVMTIITAWPGATAQEMQDQVAEAGKALAGTALVRPQRNVHPPWTRLHYADPTGQNASV